MHVRVVDTGHRTHEARPPGIAASGGHGEAWSREIPSSTEAWQVVGRDQWGAAARAPIACVHTQSASAMLRRGDGRAKGLAGETAPGRGL
jgi:hypothetical protein